MNHNIINLIINKEKELDNDELVDLLIEKSMIKKNKSKIGYFSDDDINRGINKRYIEKAKFNKKLFRHLFDECMGYVWKCDNKNLIKISKYMAICYPEYNKIYKYKIFDIKGKIDIYYFLNKALKADNLDFIKFLSMRTIILIIDLLPENYEKNAVLKALLDNLGQWYHHLIMSRSFEISNVSILEKKIDKFLELTV